MEYEKIKEFGEAIKSGILILPDDEEDGNIICLEKGSGKELLHYIGTAIANLANAADITVLDILPDVIREAVHCQRIIKDQQQIEPTEKDFGKDENARL